MPPRRSAAIPMIRATESFGRFFLPRTKVRTLPPGIRVLPARGSKFQREQYVPTIPPAIFRPSAFRDRESGIGMASNPRRQLRSDPASPAARVFCQNNGIWSRDSGHKTLRESNRTLSSLHPRPPLAIGPLPPAVSHGLAKMRRPTHPQVLRGNGKIRRPHTGTCRNLYRRTGPA